MFALAFLSTFGTLDFLPGFSRSSFLFGEVEKVI